MTKAQEMQAYDKFVSSLPQDSYLRPWLHHVRDHVDTALRCDVIPEFTPQETYHQCQQSRNDTASYIRKQLERKRSDAARIIADAKKEAERITDAAQSEVEEIRSEFRSQVYQLKYALNEVA